MPRATTIFPSRISTAARLATWREAGGLGCSDRLAGGGIQGRRARRLGRLDARSAVLAASSRREHHSLCHSRRGPGSQHGFAGAWAEPAAPVRRHAGAARLSRARRRELRGSVKIFRCLPPRFELAFAGSDQWHFVRLKSLRLINLTKSQPLDLYLDFARDYFFALGLTRARRHGPANSRPQIHDVPGPPLHTRQIADIQETVALFPNGGSIPRSERARRPLGALRPFQPDRHGPPVLQTWRRYSGRDGRKRTDRE